MEYIYSVKFLDWYKTLFARYFSNDVLKSLVFQGLFKRMYVCTTRLGLKGVMLQRGKAFCL